MVSPKLINDKIKFKIHQKLPDGNGVGHRNCTEIETLNTNCSVLPTVDDSCNSADNMNFIKYNNPKLDTARDNVVRSIALNSSSSVHAYCVIKHNNTVDEDRKLSSIHRHNQISILGENCSTPKDELNDLCVLWSGNHNITNSTVDYENDQKLKIELTCKYNCSSSRHNELDGKYTDTANLMMISSNSSIVSASATVQTDHDQHATIHPNQHVTYYNLDQHQTDPHVQHLTDQRAQHSSSDPVQPRVVLYSSQYGQLCSPTAVLLAALVLCMLTGR